MLFFVAGKQSVSKPFISGWSSWVDLPYCRCSKTICWGSSSFLFSSYFERWRVFESYNVIVFKSLSELFLGIFWFGCFHLLDLSILSLRSKLWSVPLFWCRGSFCIRYTKPNVDGSIYVVFLTLSQLVTTSGFSVKDKGHLAWFYKNCFRNLINLTPLCTKSYRYTLRLTHSSTIWHVLVHPNVLDLEN